MAGKQTIKQLADNYSIGEKRIRKYFDQLELSKKIHQPRPVVLAMDATFWGRKTGVFVARDLQQKENLYWKEIQSETPTEYRLAVNYLTELGYEVKGIVIDGKRGVKELFRGLPVQYCQFHQTKTVTRYLTRKPKTFAGQSLRWLALTLSKTDEKTFSERLKNWYQDWGEFLNERTPCSCCKPNRWPYTHRKLRSAYRSLKTNLPYLFVYQKYPEIGLPNTTNTLDGSFSHLKNQVGIHRGKISSRRYKIIQEILIKKEGRS